jgi:hypothetical protein
MFISRRRDAPEDTLAMGCHIHPRHRRGHALARGAALPGQARVRQQLAEQARLLLLNIGRLLGEKVGVLQAVVYAVLIDVGEALPCCGRT